MADDRRKGRPSPGSRVGWREAETYRMKLVYQHSLAMAMMAAARLKELGLSQDEINALLPADAPVAQPAAAPGPKPTPPRATAPEPAASAAATAVMTEPAAITPVPTPAPTPASTPAAAPITPAATASPAPSAPPVSTPTASAVSAPSSGGTSLLGRAKQKLSAALAAGSSGQANKPAADTELPLHFDTNHLNLLLRLMGTPSIADPIAAMSEDSQRGVWTDLLRRKGDPEAPIDEADANEAYIAAAVVLAMRQALAEVQSKGAVPDDLLRAAAFGSAKRVPDSGKLAEHERALLYLYATGKLSYDQEGTAAHA